MINIINFRLKKPPTRINAKNWLISNNYSYNFPSMKNKDISENVFHGWRFIRGLDGVIYFANCIDEGITEEEIIHDIRYLSSPKT